MKVGDIVILRPAYGHWLRYGITIRIDDSHRQTKVDVLFTNGIKTGIWEGHLEVKNETS